jgi:hypothetical protein
MGPVGLLLFQLAVDEAIAEQEYAKRLAAYRAPFIEAMAQGLKPWKWFQPTCPADLRGVWTIVGLSVNGAFNNGFFDVFARVD